MKRTRGAPTGDWSDNKNMVCVRLITRDGSPWHDSWDEVFPEDGSGELTVGQGIIIRDMTAVVVAVIPKRPGHWQSALAVAADFIDEYELPPDWKWNHYTDHERYR